MSKAKFEAVRELVTQKKYAEARLILKTMDNVTAREWEARLAVIDPSEPPDEETTRIKHMNLLIVCVVVAVILLLAANMLGFFLPAPHVDTGPQAKASALARNHEATLAAYNATVIAGPTATAWPTARPISPTPQPTAKFTPLPASVFYAQTAFVLRSCPKEDCPAGQMVRAGETVMVIGIAKGSVVYPYHWDTWYKIQPSDPSQTAEQYGYVEFLKVSPEFAALVASATVTPFVFPTSEADLYTRAPTATRVYTPMPPSTYYVLGPHDSFLRLCPAHDCREGVRLPVGAPVVVVGIEEGEYSVTTGKLWYKIQITNGNTISYQYDYAERFGTAPPTARPTLTYGPSPSPRPTITPGGPSRTPRPTPTRHP